MTEKTGRRQGTVLRFAVLLTALLGYAGGCAKTDVASKPVNPADTMLYRRLGGYDAIAAVTDSFLGRIKADTAINIFFAGLDPVQMNRVRQNVVDQLCAASGGPCLYVGRSMKDAHATLDIDISTFEKFIGHFETTLVAFKVPEREKSEVLAALRSMKGDIVTK